MTPAGLLDRTVGFVHALRDAGLAVSVSDTIDAARAFGTVDAVDRLVLREALAATTLKRSADRAAFDVLFDLWFPRVMGDGEAASGDPPSTLADAVRERVADFLANGQTDSLSVLAGDAVEAFGQAQAAPGRQSYFSYRVARELNLDEVMARLMSALLAEPVRGGRAEAALSQVLQERRAAFDAAVAGEIRRRLAQQQGLRRVAAASVRPPVEQIDFLRARHEDIEALRRVVHPLARRLATRLAARRRPGRSGRLDFRRTIRSSMATGGVPMNPRLRPRKPHKPELVLLCDVSGSVASFAQFTLLLTYALHEQFSKVRSFAFVDTCDEVTRFFDGVADPVAALVRMSREAQVIWFDGHSDYGHAFEVFEERFGAALTPRTSLLVLGDARGNYRGAGLPTLKRLVAETRRAYWLNPEPRSTWDTGDSMAAEYRQALEMVECRNAAALERFVRRLIPA